MEAWMEELSKGAKQLLANPDMADDLLVDCLNWSPDALVKVAGDDEFNPECRAMAAAVLCNGWIEVNTSRVKLCATAGVTPTLEAMADELWYLCLCQVGFDLWDGDYEQCMYLPWFLEEIVAGKLPDMSKPTKEALYICGLWLGLKDRLGVG